ncbi:TetR/AcrR family transcriptional regulator [Streptomyces sp. DSM 40750]|uniref:TetR/AcrR family transcriptional regulator n=1 Tax=Streptomyces sp. DSM 40750 TaxID=2801030 RepID=UPI00214CAD7F|nr:TetR family transcriptional regulator C-terminal domain-containing protein [Streptomyces sp. DSM 40750]UUU25792.1 TetR family transcriptional regulator C-terminal domain-containing protein [Streptomyces sp. DSM 40750]
MPRRVDHTQRRTEIAEALVRVAGRQGLHAVGMRDVAAEAGVSLRLVQYYFETKEKLLLFGLERLAERFGERVSERLRAAGDDTGPRATVEALLMAALPTDEESRTFHLLYTSYAVLSVTDPALAAQSFIKQPDAAEEALTGLLRRAQDADLLRPGADPRLEAIGLLAMSAGLGSSVLVGQRGQESAVAVLDHHLNRVFRGTAGGPGPR